MSLPAWTLMFPHVLPAQHSNTHFVPAPLPQLTLMFMHVLETRQRKSQPCGHANEPLWQLFICLQSISHLVASPHASAPLHACIVSHSTRHGIPDGHMIGSAFVE